MKLTFFSNLKQWSLTRCCSLFLVLACSVSTMVTADDKAPIAVISNATYINMHTGPGRGYPIFHVIEKGETIQLLRSKTDWIEVTTEKGQTGWVHRRFMQETVGAKGETVDIGLPGREEYLRRSWDVGFGVGQFEDVESLGLHGAYRFTNNLSIELRFTQATGSFSNSQIATLGLVHQPFPEWRFTPFFTLAAGKIKLNVNEGLPQPADDVDNVFLMGIGGHYYVSNRFMLRVEYNQYSALPSRDENVEIEEWKLGLTTFF